jgi:hypothetical protein
LSRAIELSIDEVLEKNYDAPRNDNQKYVFSIRGNGFLLMWFYSLSYINYKSNKYEEIIGIFYNQRLYSFGEKAGLTFQIRPALYTCNKGHLEAPRRK